jgi:hypothetical protein
MDKNGKVLKQFVHARLYDDPSSNFWCNSVTIAGDADDNIYVNFDAQNRIEKYSNTGELLFEADRILEYEESPEVNKVPRQYPQGTLVALSYNVFSKGIQIDGKGRIWSATVKRQKTEEEKKELGDARGRFEKYEDYMFEIFNADGVLLGRIQEEFFRGQYFRIFGDRLFLIDRDDEMTIYEYRIIEK